MQVSETMSREVLVAAPGQSLVEVARVMGEADIGSMPVGDDGELIGWVTDRDIAVRGIGEGRMPDTPISEVMSPNVEYCFEDDEVGEAARKMSEAQLHRLPVLDQDHRLVGIIALADLARSDHDQAVATAVEGISRASGT